jgi:nicotinic acid mononucleotide adenylyltransferase
MAVLAVTGAGGPALSWLLGVAGASRTVLDAQVPYSSIALDEFAGSELGQAASLDTASKIARSAYERAIHLRQGGVPVVGVACTAAIATDRRKLGVHRCHVAAWKSDGLETYSVELVKGLRDRSGEDQVASRLVVKALAEAVGLKAPIDLGLDRSECLAMQTVRYSDPVQAVLDGHIGSVTVASDGTLTADKRVESGLLSGSFNPLHNGHQQLAAAASDIIGMPVAFELSITNVDKPFLEEREVRSRVQQFSGNAPVIVSRAETFNKKARLFPGCTFVIGYDTAVRLLHPRYYGGEESQALTAFVEMRDLGCRFLVAGREDERVFRTLDDLDVHWGLDDMFSPIPASMFRADISSTDLRLAGHEA